MYSISRDFRFPLPARHSAALLYAHAYALDADESEGRRNSLSAEFSLGDLADA